MAGGPPRSEASASVTVAVCRGRSPARPLDREAGRVGARRRIGGRSARALSPDRPCRGETRASRSRCRCGPCRSGSRGSRHRPRAIGMGQADHGLPGGDDLAGLGKGSRYHAVGIGDQCGVGEVFWASGHRLGGLVIGRDGLVGSGIRLVEIRVGRPAAAAQQVMRPLGDRLVAGGLREARAASSLLQLQRPVGPVERGERLAGSRRWRRDRRARSAILPVFEAQIALDAGPDDPDQRARRRSGREADLCRAHRRTGPALAASVGLSQAARAPAATRRWPPRASAGAGGVRWSRGSCGCFRDWERTRPVPWRAHG